MTDDRRYTKDEIKAIFEEAAHAQETARRTSQQDEGLTLEELQAIGAESGITPAFIARAAARLGRGGRARVLDRFVGLPVSVGHEVELPGAMSDAEWDRLVADLRDTFAAQGKTRVDGTLRQWSNGNLRGSVEPSDHGWRLRFRTVKGDAKAGITMGIMASAPGLLMLLLLLITGLPQIKLEGAIAAIVLFFALGLTSVALAVGRQPRWAKTRMAQMEDVAHRVLERAATPVAPSATPAGRLDRGEGSSMPASSEDERQAARRRARS